MSKQDKYGKKKTSNKFNRDKSYASSEADILLADQKQDLYNENRGKERHQRRVCAGLEEDINPPDLIVKDEKMSIIDEPINKYDIKRYGTSEDAEKYLYHCHTCGTKMPKGVEFCNDKCKEYITVYNFSCKWGPDCKMCKFSKRVHKDDDKEEDDE